MFKEPMKEYWDVQEANQNTTTTTTTTTATTTTGSSGSVVAPATK